MKWNFSVDSSHCSCPFFYPLPQSVCKSCFLLRFVRHELVINQYEVIRIVTVHRDLSVTLCLYFEPSLNNSMNKIHRHRVHIRHPVFIRGIVSNHKIHYILPDESRVFWHLNIVHCAFSWFDPQSSVPRSKVETESPPFSRIPSSNWEGLGLKGKDILRP